MLRPMTRAGHRTRLSIVLFSLTLSACSLTQVEESWRSAEYQAPANPATLVVAVTDEAKLRQQIEQRFQQALAAAGLTQVTPSLRWMPPATAINRSTIEPLVRQHQVKWVIATSLTDIDTTRVYQANTPPAGSLIYGDRSGGRELADIGVAENPSSLREYVVETTLFDTGHHEMIWSVKTRTRETDDVKRAIESIVSEVLAQARKDGLLP